MKTKEKQWKAIEEYGKQLVESNTLTKKYYYGTKKDCLTLLKQKEIFNELINERHNEILKQNN